ncbi:MAG: EamA/RhaT family transporter, partial [Lysobacteraceae bacterium]
MNAPEAIADEGGSIAAQTPDSTVATAATAHRLDLGGVLLVAFGAVAFSGKAIIVKLGFRLGADAITLLALRMAVALPFFLLIGVWA